MTSYAPLNAIGTRVDIFLSQGTTLNQVIYRVRDYSGGVVDLSGFTGNCALKVTQNANTAWMLGVNFDENGDVFLVANNTTMAAIPANTYYYDVVMKDPSTNNISRPVYGIAEVLPVFSATVNNDSGSADGETQ